MANTTQTLAVIKKTNTEVTELQERLEIVYKDLSKIGRATTGFEKATQAIKQTSTQTEIALIQFDNINKELEKGEEEAKEYTSIFQKMGEALPSVGSICEKVWTSIGSVCKSLWSSMGTACEKLSVSMENTMDTMEAFNYYKDTLGDIANQWSGDYEKYGYENAEAYASSFSSRMDETIAQLSGIKFDDENLRLTSSGVKNLGLNYQEVTKYATQFASMANSARLSGENTLAASSAFSKLAGDLSSLYNTDYSIISEALQSGVVGQTDALKKYGIELTEATLQTTAYGLGIEGSISGMSQAEQMQLRMIAILNQSRDAWGNLANGIDQPSNQIMVFKNTISELTQTLGQIFMPVLQKIMPFINGIAIAVKKVIANIAGILGIQVDYDAMLPDDIASNYDSVSNSSKEIANSLDEVTESAQNAKTHLLGIDELNVVEQDTNTSSSVSQGIAYNYDFGNELLNVSAAYEKTWSEAYDAMVDKAEMFATSISVLFAPLEKMVSHIKIGDWFAVGEDVSNFVTGVFDFCVKGIAAVNWKQLGENIGDFLAGVNWLDILQSIGRVIWEGLNAGIEMFKGLFETAPVEMAIFSIIGITKLLKANTIVDFVKQLGGSITTIKTFSQAIMGSKTALAVLQNTMPNVSSMASGLQNVISTFTKSTANGKSVVEGLGASFKTLSGMMSPLTKGITGAVAGIAEFTMVRDSVNDLLTGTGSLVANIAELGVAVTGAGAAFSFVFGVPTGLVITGIVAVTGALMGLHDAVEKEIDTSSWEAIGSAMQNPGGVPIETITESYKNSFLEVSDGFSGVSEAAQNLNYVKTSAEETSKKIGMISFAMENGATVTEEKVEELKGLFEQLLLDTTSIFQQEYDIIMHGLNGSLGNAVEAAGMTISEFVAMMEGFETETQKAIGDIETEINKLEQAYTNGEITAEEYYAGVWEKGQKLNEIKGQTDEFTNSINNLNTTIEGVDFSSLLGSEEGIMTLNVGELTKQISEVSMAYSTARSSIAESTDEMINVLGEWATGAGALGLMEYESGFKAVAEKEAIEAENAQLQLQQSLDEYSNAIQLGLVERIPSVIDNALLQYEDLNWFARLFTTKDEYVQAALDDYNTNVIGKTETELSAMYEELGLNGEMWGSAAAEKLVSSIFSFDDYVTEDGIIIASTSLNQNYRQIIDGAMVGIEEASKEYGKYLVDGYGLGIEENSGASVEKVEAWMQLIDAAIHDSVMEYGSPSLTAWNYGKDAIDGYNNGIMENMESSVEVIALWMEIISKAIKSSWTRLENWWDISISKWYEESVKTMFSEANWTFWGIRDGLMKAFFIATEAAKQVWNAFAKYMNQRLILTINPIIVDGEVIFEGQTILLGTLPTFEVGGFPEDGLFMANHGELVGKFTNGKTAVANNEQIVAGIKLGVKEAVSETLAPYLADIAHNTRETADKDLSVNFGDREIARASERGRQSMGLRLVTE